ncbi:hypothetical protein [Dongshaea marina]|uniref:hypothetical protein n=1 Tax=Dongshaea marina TaxID=2047966 RepID=UPI00131F3CD9|nr:hypothetical protein [Dongshaea marina]
MLNIFKKNRCADCHFFCRNEQCGPNSYYNRPVHGRTRDNVKARKRSVFRISVRPNPPYLCGMGVWYYGRLEESTDEKKALEVERLVFDVPRRKCFYLPYMQGTDFEAGKELQKRWEDRAEQRGLLAAPG